MTDSDEEVDPILAWLAQQSELEIPSGLQHGEASGITAVEETVAVVAESMVLVPASEPAAPSGEETRRPADTCSLWVEPTLDVLAPVINARGKQLWPALIASSCSGLVSEGRSLSRLNVLHEFLYLCDPSLDCWNWSKVNFPRRPHYFKDLAEIAAHGRGFCFDHGEICNVPQPQPGRKVNSVTTGWSCTPYSTSSHTRGAGTVDHPDGHLWESWLQELVRSDADEGWAENVFGILHRESRADPDAPVKKMLVKAEEVAPQFHMAIYFMDAWDSWLFTRRRVYVHALHVRCGGAEAHGRMDSYVKACFYKRLMRG